MNLLTKVLIICIITLRLQATMYTYVEEGITLPLDDKTILYTGIPVEIVSKSDDSQKVRIHGFIDIKDKTKLYATKNLKLLLASSDALHVEGNKGFLEIILLNDNLTEDLEEAWDLSSSRFYDKCTKCHAAKVVGDHTMLEWEGLFGSMKAFAKPTREDTQYILRFLRAYAKDGIVKEVE